MKRVLGRGVVSLLILSWFLARMLRLRKPFFRFIARIVAKSGLFHEEHYRRENPDVVECGMDPLWHYVSCGDREGRRPMPLFDPCHYRSALGGGQSKPVNSLVHYFYLGRYKGYPTSLWFDTGYYLAQNPDVEESGMDPLLHFVRHGVKEGRHPSASFGMTQFCRGSSNSGENGAIPLLHSFEAGLLADYLLPQGLPGCEVTKSLPSASAPSEQEWANVTTLPMTSASVVDVIVPVYSGLAETLRCLFNVLRYPQATPFEIVVINDASPDIELVQALRPLADRGLFTYLENSVNQGFVRSANRGMRLHPERDKVLLNSDAEPYNDWIDRLRAAAHSRQKIATVTPLSNNATICSYPVFNQDNAYPLELSGEELDRLAREVNHAQVVAAPTAVGFCVYIRRDALEDFGFFDEESFGLGYGEENDFSQRAIRHGWDNVVATDVYVWHWGSTSFKGGKIKLMQKALRVLDRRYPGYRKDVAAYIAEDPLLASRRRLDEARLMRLSKSRNVLVVTHHRGGGTERFVTEEVNRQRLEGARVYFLQPAGDKVHARLNCTEISCVPNLPLVGFQSPDRFRSLLKQLAITHIQVHQLVDIDETVPVFLAECAHAVGACLEVFVHDYQAICPRINLVGPSGLYCGEPEEDLCNDCLAVSIPGVEKSGHQSIAEWRARYRLLYEAAQNVIVPDEDVAERLRRHLPGARIVVRPHGAVNALSEQVISSTRPDGILRIAVIGALSRIKGFDVLAASVQDARRRNLPLDFVLMGYSWNDELLTSLGVTVTGRYREAEAAQKIALLSPGLVWLPSVSPETFSYTLSLALALGYDVAAFDLGAIASRLRRLGRGKLLMPLEWVSQVERINDAFLDYRSHHVIPRHSTEGAHCTNGR